MNTIQQLDCVVCKTIKVIPFAIAFFTALIIISPLIAHAIGTLEEFYHYWIMIIGVGVGVFFFALILLSMKEYFIGQQQKQQTVIH